VRIPPLRARSDDIPLLAEAFLMRLCRTLRGTPKRLSDEAWSVLQGHDWPGNVRELENVLAQAYCLAPGETVAAKHLLAVLSREGTQSRFTVCARPEGVKLADAIRQLVEAAERTWIVAALAKTGTRKDAAGELGINVKTLYDKMEAYGLKPPDTDS
jgi:DNA-binding NtrC family response regulator